MKKLLMLIALLSLNGCYYGGQITYIYEGGRWRPHTVTFADQYIGKKSIDKYEEYLNREAKD